MAILRISDIVGALERMSRYRKGGTEITISGHMVYVSRADRPNEVVKFEIDDIDQALDLLTTEDWKGIRAEMHANEINE